MTPEGKNTAVGDKLREYRGKRKRDRTPEPVPPEGPLPEGRGDTFVIQEHHARRLHWDFRLERDGVLASWAVPKGLPTDTQTNRLAVPTEDHPLDYASFEGEIPKGEYGAGQVLIWDRGTYELEKWNDREVMVVLHGSRVSGRYVLFRTGENWMMHHMDQEAGAAATAGGKARDKVTVDVEGRRLRLSNLDKILYPAVGFTKSEVIDYYARIAPVLLPYVRERPLTFKRFPDGVDGESFFEKNAPSHTPDWIRTVRLSSPSSTKNRETIDFAVLADLPGLVWAANLATLELHLPMWRVDSDGKRQPPDTLVFDLDPGAPADIVACSRVAFLVRDVLREDGLSPYPKTSGKKGMQLYVPLRPKRSWEAVHEYAKQVAQRLEREDPKLVISRMTKQARGGKVFVDWSQNHQAKTTVAPYSLRASTEPTVSTPVTWDEVEECRRTGDPSVLRFRADDVLDRVDRHGDLFSGVLDLDRPLPG